MFSKLELTWSVGQCHIVTNVFPVFMDTKDDLSHNIERPTVSVKRQLNTIKVTVKYKGNIIRQQH